MILDENITLYAFRYGFATQLLQKHGLSDDIVKKLMNHDPNSKYLVSSYLEVC
jgi:site-specific recombinase XerD